MTLGEQIKKIRKCNKMTQRKLSELSNIPIRTIQDYEADKCKPKIDKLERLATALNVDLVDIIIGTGIDNENLSKEYADYLQYCVTSKRLDLEEVNMKLKHTDDAIKELETEKNELLAKLDGIKQRYDKMELLEILVETIGITVINSKERGTKVYCISEEDFSTDELIKIMECIQGIKILQRCPE